MQTVMKLQQKGKYSGSAKKTCPNCTFEHEREGKCPAVGRECRRCGQEGHFSRFSICKGRTTKSSTTRRVGDDELPADWEDANYSSGDEDVVCRVEEEDRKWPGVTASSKTAHIRMVGRERNKARDRWVNIFYSNI